MQCKNEEEIVAVIAHELGHWKLNHTMLTFIAVQVCYECFCFLLFKQCAQVICSSLLVYCCLSHLGPSGSVCFHLVITCVPE